MRKKRYSKSLYINPNKVDVIAIIDSEPEKFEFRNGENIKTKTVFDVTTSLGNKITCFFWNNSTIKKGDEVRLEGRLDTKGLVVWDLRILKRA